MKAVIIGAGAAGLVAAKNLLENNIECHVFEAYDKIGGTWIYTEDKFDKYGYPSHTCMYKNLRTNLPKETMMFEGLHYKETDESFIPWNSVLQYLNDYATKFNLNQHIHLEHIVTCVKRKRNQWTLLIKNLKTKDTFEEKFDAVFICKGHYTKAVSPYIEGSRIFKGRQLHSKEYKVPDEFAQKKVLIIGSGPSGIDISFDLAPIAETVYLSHHNEKLSKVTFPQIVLKPDVSYFTENSVVFKDGTEHEIDVIMYCTGYFNDVPFLDQSCSITVENNYVAPLFKQMISIEHPSMIFIGLPMQTFIFPLLELQVKVAINFLMDKVQLPSKEAMLAELHSFEEAHRSKGHPQRKFHVLSSPHEYLTDLAQTGKVPPIQPVIFKIFVHTAQFRMNNLAEFRNKVYQIVDNDSFTVV